MTITKSTTHTFSNQIGSIMNTPPDTRASINFIFSNIKNRASRKILTLEQLVPNALVLLQDSPTSFSKKGLIYQSRLFNSKPTYTFRFTNSSPINEIDSLPLLHMTP
ncbi:hypothetical protein ACOSQ4_004593 [Xanthoceras sorbifolium]